MDVLNFVSPRMHTIFVLIVNFYPTVTTLRLGLCYCKSVCLSVAFVHPTQEVKLFSNIFSPLCTLVPLTSVQNYTEILRYGLGYN